MQLLLVPGSRRVLEVALGARALALDVPPNARNPMSGSPGPVQDDVPRLFDSGQIETLRRAREGGDGGETAARHPWPILAEQFPRIAQAVFDLWGTPECDAYLTRLIIDDRGTRSGFPPAVLQALLDLSAQHQRQFGGASPERPWTGSRRREAT